MLLAIMEEAVLLCYGESRIMLDWLWAHDPRLALDGVEDLVDREPQ